MYNYYNTLNKLFLVCDTCNSGSTSVTSIHVADQGTVNNSATAGHHSVNVNDPVAYLGRLDVIDDNEKLYILSNKWIPPHGFCYPVKNGRKYNQQ